MVSPASLLTFRLMLSTCGLTGSSSWVVVVTVASSMWVTVGTSFVSPLSRPPALARVIEGVSDLALPYQHPFRLHLAPPARDGGHEHTRRRAGVRRRV